MVVAHAGREVAARSWVRHVRCGQEGGGGARGGGERLGERECHTSEGDVAQDEVSEGGGQHEALLLLSWYHVFRSCPEGATGVHPFWDSDRCLTMRASTARLHFQSLATRLPNSARLQLLTAALPSAPACPTCGLRRTARRPITRRLLGGSSRARAFPSAVRCRPRLRAHSLRALRLHGGPMQPYVHGAGRASVATHFVRSACRPVLRCSHAHTRRG